MQITKALLGVGVALLAAASACGIPQQGAGEGPPTPTGPGADPASLARLVGCASPETSHSAQTGKASGDLSSAPLTGLLLAQRGAIWQDWPTGIWQLRPVDPGSLEYVAGYAPFDFGNHFTYTLSSDGQRLAALTSHSGSLVPRLRVIDLPSWTEGEAMTNLDSWLDSWVGGLTFSADGTALYWVKATSRTPEHGGGRDYELYRYQLSSGETTVVTRFQSTFVPWEMRLMPSGLCLAVYGIPIDDHEQAQDSPHVLLVDLSNGHIAADVRLEGVKAANVQLETWAEDETPNRYYRPGLAWDLASERLYVAHADEERITVVDLAKRKVVQQSDIRVRVSLLKRVQRWLVPAAQAKMMPGTDRRAVLSGDGARLYIVGLRKEMNRGSDGQWHWREVPLGLQVIATDDLSQVGRLDLPVRDLALSPDGRRLLMAGSSEEFSESQGPQHPDSGLYVFDAEGLKELAHLHPGTAFSLHGFSPGGNYAYVSRPAGVGPGQGDGAGVLQVLDLETHQLVAEREGSDFKVLQVAGLRR